jgi:chromosome segregation ATPase
MFHLQSLELLHWDYCQRLTLPLDGSIITVAGPNGSGKTTLLDAMRTLLGLDCSGGRSYKTYARHANADSAWLRATVDNRAHGRQSSSRPFARCLLYSDQVTLACRIERNGGDWQRRYHMADGDISIEALTQVPEKDWLGIENWRKRLEGAGLSRAIARVLALEQGQTDRLCEYSPKELLRLVFDVFGDQEVLDRYEEARRHQKEVAEEMEMAKRELGHGETPRAQLEARVNLYRQYQNKLREKERLWTEVIPALVWSEERLDVASKLRELHRQRVHHAATLRQQATDRARLLQLSRQKEEAKTEALQLGEAKAGAQAALQEASANERPVELLVKHANELLELAKVEGDAEQLTARLQTLQAEKSRLDGRWHEVKSDRDRAQASLDQLQGQRQAPPPEDVSRFLRVLRQADIAHHVLADVIEIADPQWRDAAEGVLRSSRWVVVLKDAGDEVKAMELAERERYRHYVVAQAAEAPKTPDPASLLAVLRFADTAPTWLLRQLEQIRRVANPAEGTKRGGEWITPKAFWRDSRGGRSVWIDPSQHQFGAAAVAARRESIEKRLADLDKQLGQVAKDQSTNTRQLKAAEDAAKGVSAASELVRRSDEFEQARQQLPHLIQARKSAAQRWQTLDAEHGAANMRESALDADYKRVQNALEESERNARRYVGEWEDKRAALRQRSSESATAKKKFPARWLRTEALEALRKTYQNATQARLRGEAVEKDLTEGTWETDPTVEEKQTLMAATVEGQKQVLQQREASNNSASIAVSNARERYIDVLRSTVRRYRKNIVELGQLAGVEVSADLPHLDNDDTVLRQAELKVNFNFDGKGQIGLNDGEASGGQQVIKSLILLVGLLKDEETPGGFVFIDEPFAHLDVRNIQLVGHFLKSTRAQYVLTTPITHNVEVFEPADVTLVTSKKPAGARWAPPIGVLKRRVAQP